MRKNNKFSKGEKCGTDSLDRFREFWTQAWLDRRERLLRYTSILTNGNRADAEDRLQDIYVRALKYAPDPSDKKPMPYLKGMIRRNWIDTQPRPTVSLDEVFEKDPTNPALLVDDDIVKILERQEHLDILSGLVSSPKLKLTLELYAEGYEWEEIATILGERVRTTRFRWYKFCARVRKHFERLGITLH
jgi:DNA-directed RNA polymerase specialized sigma24 family protein